MTKLFDVTFENNKLFDIGTGFDILSVTGGKIEVSMTAAHSGELGCAVTPLSGYRAGGAKIIHNPVSGKFRQAFSVHPNGVTIESGKNLWISQNYHYDLSQGMYAILLSQVASGYQIEVGLADNTFSCVSWSDVFPISNAWHRIETYWQRGTPGSLQLWIDGVSRATITAINDRAFITTPGLGSLRATSVVSSGAIFFDSWTANDDGSAIIG